MIELGLLYQIGKDVFNVAQSIFRHVERKEEFEQMTKDVDLEYVEKSGLVEQLRNNGFELSWKMLKEVESRKLDGWKIVYEIDKANRKRYQLIVNDEVTLMGRKYPC